MRLKTLSALFLCSLSCLLAGCSTLPGWVIVQRRSAITDYRHFDNLPVAAASVPAPLPPSPEPPMRLPTGRQGEDFEALMQANGTVAFLVLQDGRLRYERYFNGHARDSLATSFSMAKSVVALLLGVLVEQGRIGSVDDPVTRYLPELLERDPRFARVTLKNLLEMRSGIGFMEEYRTPWSGAARFYLTPDLHAELAALWIDSDPDTHYHYSSGDTTLLGMALERAAGQALAGLLEQHLWQPMGAEYPASWSVDSAGHRVTKAFCCLNARAVDFARLGQLMLDRGMARGRRVLPEGWIDQVLAVREHPGPEGATRFNIEQAGTRRAAFYTWQWRRPVVDTPESLKPSDDFYAQGLHGQLLYVAPRERMVLLRLGTDYGNAAWWPELMGRIARMNGG